MTGQTISWISFSVSPKFSKPLGNVENNHFDIGTGVGVRLSKGWAIKKGYSFSGGIVFNKLSFNEEIPNLLFGEDVVQGTKSTYNRKLRFYEVGGIGFFEKKFPLGKGKISPLIGVGFSRIFGDVNYYRTEDNGPETFEQNDLEIPKYSFNTFLGFSWTWLIANKNSLSLRPLFEYRSGKVKSSDLLASSSFNANTISIELSLQHNLK